MNVYISVFEIKLHSQRRNLLNLYSYELKICPILTLIIKTTKNYLRISVGNSQFLLF